MRWPLCWDPRCGSCSPGGGRGNWEELREQNKFGRSREKGPVQWEWEKWGSGWPQTVAEMALDVIRWKLPSACRGDQDNPGCPGVQLGGLEAETRVGHCLCTGWWHRSRCSRELGGSVGCFLEVEAQRFCEQNCHWEFVHVTAHILSSVT